MTHIDERHRVGGVRGQRLAGGRIAQLLDIAVVGGNDDLAIGFAQAFHDLSQRLVHGLDRLDTGVDVAGMADHVGVGDVAYKGVVFAGTDRFAQFVGQFEYAHFRLQIVGGHLG